jgi:hypothetical protein
VFGDAVGHVDHVPFLRQHRDETTRILHNII